MKSRRIEDADRDSFIHYDLKRKNYDDLILTDLFTPRLLVLVLGSAGHRGWVGARPPISWFCGAVPIGFPLPGTHRPTMRPQSE